MKKISNFSGLLALITGVFSLLSFFLLNEDRYHAISIQAFSSLIFFLIFVFGGGLFSIFAGEKKKKLGESFAGLLYNALFLGLLVFLNYFASKHIVFSYDATEEKIFSLAPQSKKALSQLEQEVLISAFHVAGKMEEEERNLLKVFRRENPKISWRLLDPEKNPGLVERYKISQDHVYVISFKNDSTKKETRVLGELTEENLTNALLKLLRKEEKTIYYISGHGEPEAIGRRESDYFLAIEAILAENFTPKPLLIMDRGEIPKDASAIILSAPKKDLRPEEFDLIARYLKNGGNAMFLAEHSSADIFNKILRPYGIEVEKNIIVDQISSMVGSDSLGVQPMVSSYSEHPINENFSQGTLFYTASAVYPSLLGRARQNVKELAFSSDKSWAETDLDLILSDKPIAKFDPEDEKGPISLAVAFEGSLEESKEGKKKAAQTKKSRIIVFGDSDFINNFNIRELFNRDYFLNSLNWLVGEEQQITIRARTLRESREGISKQQFGAMFLITAILFPELALIFGLFIWWNRKNR